MKNKVIFGWETVIDLHDCNNKISDVKALKTYAKEMCRILDMKAFGKPIIKYFGKKSKTTQGYTLVQLIETSSLTGHFSDYYKSAHLNLHSCKLYDPQVAIKFTNEYFGGKLDMFEFLTRHCN